MNCVHYIKWIDRWFAGDLTPAQQRELEEHLAQCLSCRQEKEHLQQMLDDIRALEQPLPEDLHEQIMTACDQEEVQRVVQRPRRSPRPYFTLVAAIAAVLLLAVSGTFGDLFPFFDSIGDKQEQETADMSASENVENSGVQITAGQQPRMASSKIGQEDAQVESVHTITIEGRTVPLPSQVLQEQYGFYVLVCYPSQAPEIPGGTALYVTPDEQTFYYTVDNNITELEKITSSLAQKGCGIFLSESNDAGVTSGQAEHGLIIVSKETRET